MQCCQNGRDIGLPTTSPTLHDPLGGSHVSTSTVASSTRRDLVLEDARPTLDPRNEMFGRGLHQSDRDRPTAPDAAAAVALEDETHPLASRRVRSGRHSRIPPDDPVAVPDPEAPQGVPDPVGPGVEVGVGQDGVAEGGGRGVGDRPGGPADGGRDEEGHGGSVRPDRVRSFRS